MQTQELKTLTFGILNITPDSFSDGAEENLDLECSLKRAKEIINNGASVLDIGAESTRPAACEVSVQEEISRLIPFLVRFREEYPLAPISIDSRKASVVKEALNFDVQYINDVSGLQGDPEMVSVIAEYMRSSPRAGNLKVILMHSKGGIPPSLRSTEIPDDFYDEEGGLLESMKKFFVRSIELAGQNGIDSSALILDPGIGFGKNPKQSFEILDLIPKLKAEFGLRILVGASRKSFLNSPYARGFSSEAYEKLALERGADIIRTHLT